MFAEAQCLWAIRRVLGDEVPVPEVYGWRVDGRDVFIYMQLIRGDVLGLWWDTLSISDKTSVYEHLRKIMASLRQVEQDLHDPFIGSINRHILLDYVFDGKPPGGPFKTTKLFHDWLFWLPQNWLPGFQIYEDPYRTLLPDTEPIKLTHCDLHRDNIIISATTPPRVLAIVDWGQSGWYPAYWEYCKACYTSRPEGEWRTQWIPMFLTPRWEEHEVFAEYIMAMGSV